jgi:hypothetical protein
VRFEREFLAIRYLVGIISHFAETKTFRLRRKKLNRYIKYFQLISN